MAGSVAVMRTGAWARAGGSDPWSAPPFVGAGPEIADLGSRQGHVDFPQGGL
jgi:hypothetical protein